MGNFAVLESCFWKDGFRRLVKNKVAMVSFVVILLVMIFSFIVPAFYPYSYKEQIKGANHLAPMEYSAEEQARIEAGEQVFPHILGTDRMGRDYAIRVMMGKPYFFAGRADCYLHYPGDWIALWIGSRIFRRLG